MVQDTASALFGVEGLQVIGAEAEADGTVTVWAVTDHPGAAACPECGTMSGAVHEYLLTRPRDLRRGLDEVSVCWLKRRWKCQVPACERKTFTESLPAVPPRCRLTARLRQLAGAEVAERGCTVAEAARWQCMSWPVAHQAFAGQAARPMGLVAHLGIDEHRRGRPRWRIDADTGEYVLLADRWHTCFSGLAGDQGLLGQVEGRTADDAAYWLAKATSAWRDGVEVVATGMCSIYASAVRRMLPRARLVVDLFHVVQLAVKMDTLGGDRRGQEILAAWIGKEKLRDVLNLRAAVTGSTPCERDVRDRLFRCCHWCAANDDVPELLTLARTISRWEDELVSAVLTGVTNARSESLNRIAKLEARLAYSFRNPANQRRRVRIACTRGTRRSQNATTRQSRLVTGRKHDPG